MLQTKNAATVHLVPSGNFLHSELENGPVEIVDLPIENGGSFQFAM